MADPAEYRFIDYAGVYENTAYGIKNVSSQDWYFKMLSDADRKMPFGFVMEAVMQTGVLVVTQQENIRNPLMMFNSCRDVFFYEDIIPGDKLETEVKLRFFRGGVASYAGTAYVNHKTACEMLFTLIHPDEIKKYQASLTQGRKNGQIC